MWVESEVGVGSVFYFTVPAEEAAVSTMPVESNPALKLLEGRHLLLVTKGGRGRDALQRYAQRWQMRCTWAKDAQAMHESVHEAVQTLSNQGDSWDVALLDMDLPDADGLTLATQLMALPAWQEKPVLLMATRGWVNIRQRAHDAGVRGPLYKPLKEHELLAALAAALGGQSPDAVTASGRASPFDQYLGQENPLEILLAEDNVVNQKVALLLLDRLGYRADVAASGQEVVEAIQRQHYDVVLMDVHMPEMDGIEATRRIFTMLPASEHPYVVAMTAAAMQEDRERCEAVGMHDFISKPVKVEELVRALLQARAWISGRIQVS
jgi:CheY-like chemotaxis protein